MTEHGKLNYKEDFMFRQSVECARHIKNVEY